MKGKGKGKESVDSGDICPLGFLDFTPIDHTRICQKYTSILQRSESDGVSQDDLDALQLELETLLVSVTKRGRELEQEMQLLVSWQEKKEKPTGKIPEMGKRSRLTHGKPKKRFKDGTGKAHPLPVGRPKSKNVQTKIPEYEFNDATIDVPRQHAPKNDAPNRFWASIEPYCSEITQDDLKVLEDLVKSHEEDSDYYKVPALGKHFTIKWTQEDLLEEQKEGMRVNDKRRGLSNSSSLNYSESDRILKKVSDKAKDTEDSAPFGSLTQRLVSCLIEENLVASLDETLDGPMKDQLEEGSAVASSKANFIKSLNISNAVNLEKRIRRELEEQGILDVDEVAHENPSGDEIFAELTKCQAELKAVSASNVSQTKKLLRLAKDEIAKQEIRKRLQLADSEVMDIYRRIIAARQKKRSPSKKEREQAWKALKDREQIIKQIDGSQNL